jgi:hypothetical protein
MRQPMASLFNPVSINTTAAWLASIQKRSDLTTGTSLTFSFVLCHHNQGNRRTPMPKGHRYQGRYNLCPQQPPIF